MKEYFTKISPLTKSVSLELLPVGKTRETIRVLKHLEKDEEFREKCDAIRPFIDEYIIHVVNEAFEHIDKDAFGEQFEALGKAVDSADRNERNTASSIERRIGAMIEGAVSNVMPEDCPIKKINSDLFISRVLLDYYNGDAKKQSMILGVKGNIELLRKFLISRITAVTTWMPARVIENFYLFHSNIVSLREAAESEAVDLISPLVQREMMEDTGYVFFLKQEDINKYNRIISGLSDENGIIEKGLNGIINEYNIGIRGTKNQRALRKLDKLNKQILMATESMFHVDVIENDDQVRELFEDISPISDDLDRFEAIMRKTAPSDIVVCGDSIRALSHILYSDNLYITNILSDREEIQIRERMNNAEKKAEKRKIEKELESLTAIVTNKDRLYTLEEINSYTGDNVSGFLAVIFSERCTLLHNAKNDCEKALQRKADLRSNEDVKEAVKAYFEDGWKDIRDILRLIRNKGSEKTNNEFYDEYDIFDEKLSATIRANNLVRNYFTKNVSETIEQYNASFGHPGRGSSKWYIGQKFDKKQNAIIRMDEKYYFFILTDTAKPVDLLGADQNCNVMVYTKMQKPFQIIPKMTMTRAKVFFDEFPEEDKFVLTEKLSDPVVITREVFDMYTAKLFKKPDVSKADPETAQEMTETFKRALRQIIDVFIKFCTSYTVWEDRPFTFKKAGDYTDLNDFYSDVERYSAMQKWMAGNRDLIFGLVEKEKGLLFEISNKGLRNFYETGDYSRLNDYARTFLYFFTEENRKNPSLRLNSRPQLIYREAAAGEPIIHKEGSILVNRKDVNGNFIPEEIYRQIYVFYNDKVDSRLALTEDAQAFLRSNLAVTKKARYDIIKDRRFYKEQFRIVLSFTKNSECQNREKTINTTAGMYADTANRVILVRNSQDTIYMTVTDPKGTVLEERSLNVIEGTDYHKRLFDLENQNREQKSKGWKYTSKIKDVRDGYFDKAVSEIVKTIVEYDAIVIMERVSDKARDKGFAIGNSAYKSFEKKLLTRLSDLHLKNIEESQPGSITNPYQLCISPLVWDNDYQNGIVYFVNAAGAAGTDPATGFRSIFDVSRIHTKEGKCAWLSKFSKLSIDEEKHSLDIAFDYDLFKTYFVPEKSQWEMSLYSGITEYNREYKFNSFIEHPFDEVAENLREEGIDPANGILEAVSQNRISGKTVDLLYNRLLKSLWGTVGAHDGLRSMYVSPVTGEVTDISKNTAINLGKRFTESRALKREA